MKPAATTAIEQDPRWAAVQARDPAADRQFVYAVKTTGIYCRPSSPTRLPRPENVEFFDSAEQAEAAGYRPSRRAVASMTDVAEQHAALVAAACRQIESAEQAPGLEALAESAGMSASHFHRVFKAVTGLTPKAYTRARRARKVREQLVPGASVTEVILDAGFNSNSRFYADSTQVLGMKPADYRAGGTNNEIRFALGECSLGHFLVAQSSVGVCAIFLGDDPDALLHDLQDKFPRAHLIGGDSDFEQLVASVIGFIEAPGWAWTCRWTFAARPSRNGSGRPCGRFRRAAPRATRKSPSASARPAPYAPWPRPARPTAWRWPSPATGWSAATATSPATAGAWNASAACWSARPRVKSLVLAGRERAAIRQPRSRNPRRAPQVAHLRPPRLPHRPARHRAGRLCAGTGVLPR